MRYYPKIRFQQAVFIITTKIEKASQKLHALAQGPNSRKKLRILMNACFSPQFRHYGLVWMLYGLTLSNTINKLEESALRLVYKSSTSFSCDLCEKDNS